MKKILFIALVTFGLTSCFKESSNLFETQAVVEFQDATVRAPAAGKIYPLIAVNNGAGALTLQVNLVGKQRSGEETIRVSVDTGETTAVQGTHFSIEPLKIAANSSTGLLKVNILTVPANRGQFVNVILMLEGNGTDITGSANHKRVGYRIAL